MEINNQEKWLNVSINPKYAEFENYRVSSFGRVYDIKNNYYLKIGARTEGKYKVVNLLNETKKKKKTILVHRLVCDVHRLEDFNALPTDQNIEVRHIDGNSQNNYLSNLEYCTSVENIRDKYKHNTIYYSGLHSDEN